MKGLDAELYLISLARIHQNNLDGVPNNMSILLFKLIPFRSFHPWFTLVAKTKDRQYNSDDNHMPKYNVCSMSRLRENPSNFYVYNLLRLFRPDHRHRFQTRASLSILHGDLRLGSLPFHAFPDPVGPFPRHPGVPLD